MTGLKKILAVVGMSPVKVRFFFWGGGSQKQPIIMSMSEFIPTLGKSNRSILVKVKVRDMASGELCAYWWPAGLDFV